MSESRCLPVPSSSNNDLTYIGEGKQLTLEQNDWLGHAVTTQTAALLLREVLGFEVKIVETPMAWGDAENNPLSRLASSDKDVAVDANLEGWALDWPNDLVSDYVETQATVERSTHEFQGRVGAYIPRYVVEDYPTQFPDYWRAYTQAQVLDLFQWQDQSNSTDTSTAAGEYTKEALQDLRLKWAENCDADAYGCDGGVWDPPRCLEDNANCIPFFHVYPEYAVGWIEQLVQNLGLNMSMYYAGWDVYDLVLQAKQRRQPVLFYSWQPHELLATGEYVRVTFPERTHACEATDTDNRFGGRDCDHEGSPVYKFTTATLQGRSAAAHEFIHKRFSLRLSDQYDLLQDLEAGGHGGNLTVQEAACQWVQTNPDIWSEWTNAVASDGLPPCSEISLDQIEQFPMSQMEEIRQKCFATKEENNGNFVVLIVTLIGAVLVLAAAYVYVERRKRRNGDSVWEVKAEELVFSNPPHIAGRGTFGLVLVAQYRGTQVAVKRVIPPKDRTKKNKQPQSQTSTAFMDSTSNHQDLESGVTTSGIHQGSLVSNANSSGMLNSSNYAGTSTRMAQKDEYAQLKADFIIEMRQLSKLRHPCITTVMGAVVEKGQEPMLVMEYMDYGSLYDMLHNKTFPLDGDLLLPILRDIAQGVRFLHAATPIVLHGDLKAANCLVDRNFRAKVADFGLSAKKTIGATGTPAWMAPELLRNESSNSAASDVYSFGIILYEVYSRKDPYEGEDMRKTLREVADVAINKRPPIPPRCPDQLATIMSNCLKSKPNARPTFEQIEEHIKTMNAEHADPGAAHIKKSMKAARSEDLLYQVFPKRVADALRDGRKVEPENKECVTIFFSDIVGFTNISATLSPALVQDMLDRLYTQFDNLSHKHDVFKIETIGDAYLCVTNLVKDQDEDHTKRIAEFAVDAVKAANETLIKLDDPSMGCVKIRVGFHSGPVIASVVGTRLPKYSMFGDSINTASRMESNSEACRIHCSEASAELLKKQCPSMPLVARGEITVKGKGEMFTYWVNEREDPKETSAQEHAVFRVPEE